MIHEGVERLRQGASRSAERAFVNARTTSYASSKTLAASRNHRINHRGDALGLDPLPLASDVFFHPGEDRLELLVVARKTLTATLRLCFKSSAR